MAFLLKNFLKFSVNKQFFKVYCQQGFKTSSVAVNTHKQNPNSTQNNELSNAQKKFSPKITLIQNQNMSITVLEDAKNLAKRRSMHLIKVQDMDSKTQRPIYKLVTSAEMIQNELSDIKNSDKLNVTPDATASDKIAAQKKSEKSLNIGSRIADHDLRSRLKNISKWLNKQHEVRILIQGSSEQDLGNCEKIYKTIEEAIKTPEIVGKIVQKRIKGSIIKFNIIPVAPVATPSVTQ